jgi:hypothetical protein
MSKHLVVKGGLQYVGLNTNTNDKSLLNGYVQWYNCQHMKSTRGSLWKKWDLHVHTPMSLVQQYGGDTDEVWDKFLLELEHLPSDFKVLGINDYIFIDGYRRLLEEKTNGRLQNIEMLLPVIELRLSKFGGTESKLSRVNYHVIFSDDLGPDIIESQFISALTSKYELNPLYTNVIQKWNALPTRRSLEDLGKLIIASVPEQERFKFSSPLEEGFNNLNFDLEHVKEILERPQFIGKHLTALGKTEWSGIKWNSQSIADKKTIINSVDMVFTASEDVEAWTKSQLALKEDNVNWHLLDCSDAHRFSNCKEKDRLGRCFTWIKADTTFLGLRFALSEYDDRVFIGNVPDIIERVKSKGSRYIEKLAIRKLPDSKLDEIWFNNLLEFNYGLVAIIGNKGSGKSALSETIGLIGNTIRFEDFSFLNDRKFIKRSDNKAQWFEATVTWANKQESSQKLSDPVEFGSNELVQFIPQSFLEKVCNEISTGKDNNFEKELSRVIFSHINISDRLGQATMEDLLEVVTGVIKEGITQIRIEIRAINRQIVNLEDECSEEYRMRVESKYHDKLQQLRDLRKVRPINVNKDRSTLEAGDENIRMERMKKIIRVIDEASRNKEEELAKVQLIIHRLNGLDEEIQNLTRNFTRIQEEYQALFDSLGFKFEDVLNLTFNDLMVKTKIGETNNRIRKLKRHLGIEEDTFGDAASTLENEKRNNLPSLKKKLQKEIRLLQIKLDEPHQRYQKYLEDLEGWIKQRRDLIGDPTQPDTLMFLRGKLRDIKNVPTRLDSAKEKRLTLSKEVYQRIRKLGSEYSRLHRGIQEFVDTHASASVPSQKFFDKVV